MLKRRIFLWMGASVLFLLFGISQEGLAKEGYRVKRGDTLYKISNKFGINTQGLKEANNLKNDVLRPNQTLIIPEQAKKIARYRPDPYIKPESYLVKKNDSLFSIAKKTGLSITEIKRINRLRTNRLKIGQKLVLSNPTTIMEVAVKGEDADRGLLGKWNSLNERKKVVRVAKGFIGTPYRFGGSSIRGLDCSALVKKVYQFFNVNLPRTAREQSHVGKRVPRDELKEGDLVFFNVRRAFDHVGIYVGNNKFVHASFRSKEVRVDSLKSTYYDKHFSRAIRVKGLSGEA
jgi:cell wall-associated NlpC family hydrolase